MGDGACIENTPPAYLSRCSIGRDKWFWVTYRSFDDLCEGIVASSGSTTTSAEAEHQARMSIMDHARGWPEQYNAGNARYVYRKLTIKRRAARPSAAQDATKPEYVYSDWTSDYDCSEGSTPHRIVKKTAKRVYVERSHRSWKEGDQVFYDVPTFVLDRQELEATGEAWSRRRRGFFYTTPYEERRQTFKPKHLEILGLEPGCSAEAVGAAYRGLAKKLHPDHGGNPESFKQLQWAYEAALETLG